MNGQFREKDGTQLVIRDVLLRRAEHPAVRPDRAEQPGPDRRQTRARRQGRHRLLQSVHHRRQLRHRPVRAGAADAFPLSSLTQIYLSTGESNFGKIGSPEIDAKIEQTLEELDPDKASALANELDKLLWAEGFSLPLTQSPGNVAVRSNLANFGAAGLADVNYTAIGFMK